MLNSFQISHLAPLLTLFLVGVTAAVTPGPTFLMISQLAMTRSRRAALAAVLGVVTSGLLWASAAIVGLAALFAAAPWSQPLLRIAGGGYLIYLGVQSWRSPIQRQGHAPPAQRGGAYLRGLMTDLLNPKSLVFFASVFVLIIRPDASVAIKLGALGVVVAVGLGCYGAVAVFFSAAAVRERYLASGRLVERACGVLMAGFGLALLFTRI